MDGLATTTAIGATGSFIMVSIALHQYDIMTLLCAFLGALLAFLYYNRPPATIYLGDAGSLCIGGFLATVPFFLKWGTYNTYGYLTPVIILTIPIVEIVSLIVIRSYKGIPFYKGSPDHFCHYLQKNGWNKYGILLYVFCISTILAGTSSLYMANQLSVYCVLVLMLSLLSLWVFLLVKKSN